MSFKEAQEDVERWVSQFKMPYWPPLSIMARISEESGELAKELNDRYGGRVKKSGEDVKDIGDEIGDVIFGLICLANSQGIDLDESWERIISKCYGRDNDRYEKKDEIKKIEDSEEKG